MCLDGRRKVVLFIHRNYAKKHGSPSELSQDTMRIRRNLREEAEEQDTIVASEVVMKRKDEINAFMKELSDYKISFSSLVAKKPKKRDEREQLLAIAKYLSNNSSFKEQLVRTKKLPIKTIIQELDVPKRLIRANRYYLIAVSLLLIGPYSEIQEYLLEGIK